MYSLSTGTQIIRTFGLRDGLLRLQYEISRGTGWMLFRMRAARGWKSWSLTEIAPGLSADTLLAELRREKRRFFFSDSRALAPELKKLLGDGGERAVLDEAYGILEGKLPFFGRRKDHGAFPPNWLRNPVTGEEVAANRPWTGMRFASEDYGDLKFILEASRFLFVYPLARAYALTGDDRFAEAFWRSVEDWASLNPPMLGPLWICGQESSLRILAWSFALHSFAHSSATTPVRAALLLSMIAAHAWRTVRTIGYSRSQRSNHLLSEAVGLWTVGTLFPELKDAEKWRRTGASLLNEAARDQITSEGVHLQNSFNYQRMVLHLLLWTVRLAEIRGVELDPVIRARTGAAFEFLREFVDPESGRAPNHGSNDGTNLIPLCGCEYEDFRPLLQLGARVLGLSPVATRGPWDETALWFCGFARTATSGIQQPADISSEAGYFRLGSRSAWAMVRAGHYQRRPFQADQLHVDIWWRGLNLARDAGTYLYNGVAPWDNGLAGTRVHNTVMVDGRDQMRRGGRFLWLDWAQAFGKSMRTKSSGFADRFEGGHDGYRGIGVAHRRTVQLIGEHGWLIVDDLAGSGHHELRLHWLTGDWPCNVLPQSPFVTVLTTPVAPVRWRIYCQSEGSVDVVRAGKSLLGKSRDENALLGWESPTYGELRPAVSLLYTVAASLPQRVVTAVLIGDVAQVRQDRDRVVVESGNLQHEVALVPTEASAGMR